MLADDGVDRDDSPIWSLGELRLTFANSALAEVFASLAGEGGGDVGGDELGLPDRPEL